MNQPLEIVKVPNIYDPNSRTFEKVEHTGKPLLSYVDVSGKVVVVEGRILGSEELETFVPKPGQQIILRQVVGKTFLRDFLLVAVAIVGSLVSAGIIGGLAAGSLWATVAGAAIAVGGSLLVNLILPPQSPTNKNQDTPTYSWNGSQLTAQQGLVIPKGFGKFRYSGNVIESYNIIIANKMYTNVLIALTHGPVKDISSILINDNPIESYTGVTYEKRLGTVDQQPCDSFHDITNEYPQSTKLTVAGGASTFNGHRSDTQCVEVEVVFPNGLYQSDSKGNLKNLTVSWMVEVSLNGGGFNIVLAPRTTANIPSGDVWAALASDQISGGPNPGYAYASDSGNHNEGDSYAASITAPYYDFNGTFVSNQTKPVKGTWTKNPNNPANKNPMGVTLKSITDWQSVTQKTSAASQQPQRDTIRIDNLPSGTYNVRVTKIGSDKGQIDVSQVGISDEIWVSAIREISHNVLSYNGLALLSIRALATDKLNGAGLNISAIVDHGVPPTAGYKNLVLADSPQVFFRLNDTGSTFLDLSPYQRNGTQQNVASGGFSFQQPSLITKSTGKSMTLVGTGLSGTTPYFTTTGIVSGTDFSLDAWIKPASFVRAMELFDNGGTQGFYIHTSGALNFFHSGANHLSATILTANQVYHVGVRVKAGVLRFIINGVLDANTYSGIPSFTITNYLAFFSGSAQAMSIHTPAIRAGRFRERYLLGTSRVNLLEDYTGDNAAIVALDMLTNKVYGGAQPPTLMDEVALKKLADRCNEVVTDGRGSVLFRHTFNGVFDQVTTLWDNLIKLGNVAQCVFLRSGLRYTVIVDMPAVPVQIFNMGNIIAGSFKESWLGSTDRANSVDVLYMDENQSYQRQVATVQNALQISSGKPIQAAGQIEGLGITKEAEAWRLGNYLLLGNVYNIRAVEWAAFTEAISCFPGDVVTIAHDAPKWGNSGRIVACQGTKVRIDQDVTLNDDGTVYSFLVRLDNVSRASGVITSIDTVGNIITLGSFTGPDLTIKRLVTATVDAKVIGWGTGIVEVLDATGLNVGDAYVAYDTDVLQTALVVVPTGGYSGRDLTLVSTFSTDPLPMSLFILGGTIQPKQFRVLQISRLSDISHKIQAIEYNPAIYTDSDPQITPSASGYQIYGPFDGISAAEVSNGAPCHWTSPSSALIQDNIPATSTSTSLGSLQLTNWLVISNINPRVGVGETISGIQVVIKAKATVPSGFGEFHDTSVFLSKDGLTTTGSNRGAAGSFASGTAYTSLTYGGSNDLWGATLVPADVNGAGFSIMLSFTLDSTFGSLVTLDIDEVEVTVFTSKAADAVVTGLQVQEAFRKINGVYKTFLHFSWKNGKTTTSSLISISRNGLPEVFEDETTATSYELPVNAGDVIIGHIVGRDYLGNMAPFSLSPAINTTVIGIVQNLLRNATWNQGLNNWGPPQGTSSVQQTQIGDTLIAGVDDDGFFEFSPLNNITGQDVLSNLTNIYLLEQRILTGFTIGGHVMLSMYVRIPAGCKLTLSLVLRAYSSIVYPPSTGTVVGSILYDMSNPTPNGGVGRVRVFSNSPFTIPGGTTMLGITLSINANSGQRFDTLPAGKIIKVDHVLVEPSSVGATLPSVWSEVDDDGIVGDIFQGNSTLAGSQGSTLPIVVPQFSFTDTTTAITFNWTNLSPMFPNSQIAVIIDGSLAVSGLTAGATYKFLPYWSTRLGKFLFVIGNAGTSTLGAIAITAAAYAADPSYVQKQKLDGNIPLTDGPITITVPGAGTGGGPIGGRGL